MASFFRRRRSLVVKAIIVIPVLWFLTVLILGHAPSLGFPGGGGEDGDGGERRGDRGLLPPFLKNSGPGKKEAPLQPPHNPQDKDKEVVQFRNVAAEEEDLKRQREEEERKRKEVEEEERRRKEAALKYEEEKKARKIDPNAPAAESRADRSDRQELAGKSTVDQALAQRQRPTLE